MKKGVTRIVILCKEYVIKIPNFTYSHSHFLKGAEANWSERMFTKTFKDCEMITPTVFCAWFGLFSIQKRVEPLDFEIESKPYLMSHFENVCNDFKTENFGYLENRVVCIDY